MESFGHYQLQDVLGRGGMGQVFRAYDASTDRVIALKVLPPHLAEDPEFQERFRREARVAASLNDPHVVPIHGYGAIDGQLYVDMRLIEGRDLEQYIAENGGRLSPQRAVAVIEQVAAALDSAHNVGLIHRDVKPSNILVTTARDFVYLIDFGIARTAADTALTHTGHTMGTMAYMAPERFRGTTDHRADVYSLACVLYECLTGRRPYPGDSFEEQVNGHLNAVPPRPSAAAPDVPAALDAVVAKGMAKDVERRYQTAIALADDAKAALVGTSQVAALELPAVVPAPAGPPPSASPPATPPPSATPPATPPPNGPDPRLQQRQPQSRRLILGMVGASILALAAVAALVIALVSHSNGPAKNTAAPGPTSRSRPPRSSTSAVAQPTVPPLPVFAPPTDLGANCQYPPSADPATKPVNPPRSGKVSTVPAQISATISTNFGDMPIHLANGESPCAVNSFISLAQQQFFNNTECGRMINAPEGGSVLCGGPDNEGTGGPGYEFADEYPTNQYPAGDPALRATVLYPRGTIAMATSGPNTNGSQFFIVYRDAEVEPQCTVFGSVDQAGMAALDKIAAVGVAGNRDSGLPASTVTIKSVRIQ
jgi:serine/threonine protein kinase